jgi:subtilisin family serine protease
MKTLTSGLTFLLMVIPCSANVAGISNNSLSEYETLQEVISYAKDGDILEVSCDDWDEQEIKKIDLMGKDIIVRSDCPESTGYLSATGFISTQKQAIERSQPTYVPGQMIVKFRKRVADLLEAQLTEVEKTKKLPVSGSLNNLNKKHKLKKIRPLFRDFKQRREELKQLLKKKPLCLTKKEHHILKRLKRAEKKVKVPDLDRIYILEFGQMDDQQLQEVLGEYKREPDVEYAELNYIVSIDTTPNDPLYSVQWSLNNTGQMYPESGDYNHPPGTPGCDIDAPEAWDIHIVSSDIIVAVADTGIDYTHRDIDDNMWTDPSGYHGYDFVNSDNYPMDDHGHGTHCAGIIAAEGHNGLDIAGVCWNVKIMALKSLDEGGYGPYANAVAAFNYAVNNGADVISNSWGKDEYSQAMQDVIDYAYSQGVIIVASAGNADDSAPHYPANNEHVISVAATNSKDEKATFSTYGDWVDLAAPGVDILSLRAGGSDAGTPYNNYTTIMSGTSMSCPYVSAACALLLSKNPMQTVDEVNHVLSVETDPISPGICRSNGRLNIHKAIKPVSFDKNHYSCSEEPRIRLIDFDLEGEPSVNVTLETDGGDHETVMLESSTWPWLFESTVTMAVGAPIIEDGILQISHGQTITVIYEDADDGTGNPTTEIDSAVIDCQGPIISNVQIEWVTCWAAVVIFQTDEVSTGSIRCGLSCGGPYTIIGNGVELTTSHRVFLTGLTEGTDYYFVVDASDIAGNQTTDDNGGACYLFSTTLEPVAIYVPADYPTIQEAINAAVDYTAIIVADGIYSGPGNRDIDFKGKVITVRSANGPTNCIIDCQGSAVEPHRGFYFRNYETRSSILDGFTITNAYGRNKGGAIKCYIGSPTIQNCIISNNTAGIRTECYSGGGGIHSLRSSPKIINCIVSDNYSYDCGGGIFIEGGNVQIINCIITNNDADYISCFGTWSYGGGICSQGANVLIRNCLIANNWSHVSSGGLDINRGSADIINCTIANNSAGQRYGGVSNLNETDINITNSIIWGNQAPEYPQLADDIIVSYSNIEGSYSGVGNIDINPNFVGDYRLSHDSPCVNAGDPYYSPAEGEWDIDGEPRVMGGRIDMGADELRYMPTIGFRPSNISFFYLRDGGEPRQRSLSILNLGVGTVNWEITCDCDWLHIDPNSGSTEGGEVDEVTLSVDISGLDWGDYDCELTISDPNAGNSPQMFQVNLHVIIGDFDGDSCVGLPDLMVIAAHWLETDCNDCSGVELTDDGDVDGADFAVFAANWTKSTLVAYWRLDNNAEDSSGNRHHGTLIGGASFVTDPNRGQVLSLNGTDGYVEIPGYKGIAGTNSRTCAAWIQVPLSLNGSDIISWGDENSQFWLFFLDGYGRLRVSISGGVVRGLDDMRDGQWHHVAAAWDSTWGLDISNVKLYVDGYEITTETPSAKHRDINTGSVMDVKVGLLSSTNARYFDGKVDDVRIYDRALAAEEIADLAGED